MHVIPAHRMQLGVSKAGRTKVLRARMAHLSCPTTAAEKRKAQTSSEPANNARSNGASGKRDDAPAASS